MVHLDAVYRLALTLSGQEAQAQDLTQATMLKSLRTLDSFTEGTSAKAWLFQILRNTWIDILRRHRTAGTVLPLDESLLAAPAETEQTQWTDSRDLLENFEDKQVIRALMDLPDDQRLALYLVDVEQLDHREAAEIMGVAVGTIKSRTSRARAALKKQLPGPRGGARLHQTWTGQCT